MKKIFTLLFTLVGISAFAQDYIAVAKNGNVYDEANAKYITVNQNNEDVTIIPGMVFLTTQHTPGWYKVEYSPGLHAFIPDQITANSFNPVVAGTYDVANNPGQKLSAQNSSDNWTATVDGKSYKGVKWQDMVIFTDNNNNMAFTLVDLGNGPVVISYDNSVTKFF